MNSELTVIIGLGVTGLACARYFAAKGLPVAVTDSRDNPPALPKLRKELPDVEVVLGGISEKLLSQAHQLVVSPGISLKEPVIAHQIANGITALGDIELFVCEARAPILAITGSNGKTTVTTLLGKMIAEAGYRVGVCGNIGQPALDLLALPSPDFYVMELSSFQLETTESLKADVAVVLNVTEDHLDRYENYDEYLLAKQRIYRHCRQAIVNDDAPEIWRDFQFNNPPLGYSLKPPKQNRFGLRNIKNEVYLACGDELLMPTSALKLKGSHHFQNALCALAMGQAIQLPLQCMLNVLKNFSGLAHRCELVAEHSGIFWYNDSKATNVGACEAAITTIGEKHKGHLILIAGGDGKCADFSPLKHPVAHYVSHVILLGQDADRLQEQLADVVALTRVDSLPEAVTAAATFAKSGDAVLLSPACASLDMFENYEHRGEVFRQAVLELNP